MIFQEAYVTFDSVRDYGGSYRHFNEDRNLLSERHSGEGRNPLSDES
jgi:hypothetical protein